MRIFGFEIKAPFLDSIKRVDEYTLLELQQFREQLRSQKRLRRRIRSVCLTVVLLMIAISIYATANRWITRDLCVSVVICLVLIGGGSNRIATNLTCPACQLCVLDHVRVYCPECGGKLQWGDWNLSGKCLACSKAYRSWTTDDFRSNHCTHCGIPLQDAES